MHKITPFLWFNDQAEEAANFYTSIFKNSKVSSINRMPDGKIMTATFELEDQKFFALDGGPMFSFTLAISFFINCKTQEEVDELWDKLISGGGEESMCGWLKDKYGLSWQIIPSALGRMLGDQDPEKAQRVMQAMLKMHKIDVQALEQAYDPQ